MKRFLFLLLILFNINFVKSAEASKYDATVLKVCAEAVNSQKKFIVNFLSLSHKSHYFTEGSLQDGLTAQAASNFAFITNPTIRNYIYKTLKMHQLLGFAKLVYDSISDDYKKQQSDTLLNPYE